MDVRQCPLLDCPAWWEPNDMMNPILIAYLDPGTGAILLQLLVAGFLTASVAFRRFFYSIFGLFRKSNPSPIQDLDKLDKIEKEV